MSPKQPLSPTRLSWIDYNRGISIILICYFHLSYLLFRYYNINADSYWILKYFNIFFYGFRMPLFFLISGLLVESSLIKKGFSGYVKNRFNTIFFPLLVWGVIKITLQITLGHISPKDARPILYFDLLVDPRQISPFWYLHALFCVSALYALMKAKVKLSPVYNVVFGLLLYLVSAYVTAKGLQVGFAKDVFKYYAFFAFGDLLSGNMLSQEAKNFFYSGKRFLLFLAPFLVVQTIITMINLSHHNLFHVENKIPLLYLVQGILGCAFCIAFSFLLQKWNAVPVLKKIGFHSLYIYCMHYIVITVCCIFFVKILHLHNTLLFVGICWAAALGLPILIYKISMRYNLWWLFTLNKPKDSGTALPEVHEKSPETVISGPLSVLN
jgi:fucose 4-O-acetylase-like acetyltransferase